MAYTWFSFAPAMIAPLLPYGADRKNPNDSRSLKKSNRDRLTAIDTLAGEI